MVHPSYSAYSLCHPSTPTGSVGGGGGGGTSMTSSAAAGWSPSTPVLMSQSQLHQRRQKQQQQQQKRVWRRGWGSPFLLHRSVSQGPAASSPSPSSRKNG